MELQRDSSTEKRSTPGTDDLLTPSTSGPLNFGESGDVKYASSDSVPDSAGSVLEVIGTVTWTAPTKWEPEDISQSLVCETTNSKTFVSLGEERANSKPRSGLDLKTADTFSLPGGHSPLSPQAQTPDGAVTTLQCGPVSVQPQTAEPGPHGSQDLVQEVLNQLPMSVILTNILNRSHSQLKTAPAPQHVQNCLQPPAVTTPPVQSVCYSTNCSSMPGSVYTTNGGCQQVSPVPSVQHPRDTDTVPPVEGGAIFRALSDHVTSQLPGLVRASLCDLLVQGQHSRHATERDRVEVPTPPADSSVAATVPHTIQGQQEGSGKWQGVCDSGHRKLMSPEGGASYKTSGPSNTGAEKQTNITEVDCVRGNGTYGCLLCQRTFTQETNLAAHYRLHDEIFRKSGARTHLECSICKMFFSREKDVTRHRNMYHSKISVDQPDKQNNTLLKASISSTLESKCSICNRQFATARSLSNHRKVHNPIDSSSGLPKPHSCKLCKVFFVWKSDARNHNNRFHSQNTSVHGTKPQEDMYTGSQPNKRASNKHASLLAGCKQCEICSLWFHQSGLTKHQIIHEAYNRGSKKRKPYSCDSCPSFFNNKSRYAIHRKSHYRRHTAQHAARYICRTTSATSTSCD